MKKILLFLIFGVSILASSCRDKCPLDTPDPNPHDSCYYELSPIHDAKNVSLNPTFYWCDVADAVKYRFWLDDGVFQIDTFVLYNQFSPARRYMNSIYSHVPGNALNHLTLCTWKVWSINAAGDTTLIVDSKFTTKDIRPDIAGRFRMQRWAAGNNSGLFQFGGFHFEEYTDVDVKLGTGSGQIEITDLNLGLTRVLGHPSCCEVYTFQGYNNVSQFPFHSDRGDFKLSVRDSFQLILYMEDDPNNADGYYYYGRQR